MQRSTSLKLLVSFTTFCFSGFTASRLAAQPGIAAGKPFTVVVVEVQAARVGFYDSQSGVKMGSVNVGFKPHEIEISKDGSTAYVANFGIEDYDHRIGTPGNSISVIDIPLMKEQYKIYINDTSTTYKFLATIKAPHGIKLRPSKEEELFANTEQGGDYMLVYDVTNRKLKRSYALPAGTHNFIFSPDGQFLYLFSGVDGVFKVNPQSGEILAGKKLSTPVRGLHYTADKRFIIAAANNEAVLLDPEDLSIHRHYQNLGIGQILYPRPTPDGKYILLPDVYAGIVAVLDMESGTIIHKLAVGPTPISIAISPDGNKAFVSSHTGDYFSSIDLQTFEIKKFATANGSNGIGIGERIKI
jgi:DNA-binding beta-propeller fold protein YncE